MNKKLRKYLQENFDVIEAPSDCDAIKRKIEFCDSNNLKKGFNFKRLYAALSCCAAIVLVIILVFPNITSSSKDSAFGSNDNVNQESASLQAPSSAISVPESGELDKFSSSLISEGQAAFLEIKEDNKKVSLYLNKLNDTFVLSYSCTNDFDIKIYDTISKGTDSKTIFKGSGKVSIDKSLTIIEISIKFTTNSEYVTKSVNLTEIN